MFTICTAFDVGYIKYGYPLICSILNKYPAAIHVVGIDFPKSELKRFNKITGVKATSINLDVSKSSPEYFKQCFSAKVISLQRAMDNSIENIALIDADCLFLDRLDEFEKIFNDGKYDLGVFHRIEKEKEYLRFCSHNVFLRNSYLSKEFIQKWIDLIPNWDHKKFRVGSAYAEQACMWNAYDQMKNSIKLLNIAEMNIPILHAKGAKYPFHKQYTVMKYEERCKAEIAEFENKYHGVDNDPVI